MRLLSHLVLLNTFIVVGCALPPYPCDKRHVVSDELTERTGAAIGSGGGILQGTIPDGVSLQDGLTEQDAATLALWNNAAFHQTLSQLGVSAAQLFDAGLLPDPQFVLFFPLGTKQLEFTSFQAIDALWLRPIRKRAAELDLCQLSQAMIQNGLDVVRDTRLAHAALVLAQDRAKLAEEAFEIRNDILKLSKKRLDAGDISELELTTSRIEALRAEALAKQTLMDVTLAQQRLRTFIGLPIDENEIVASASARKSLNLDAADSLVEMAFAMRPDLRAAEIRYEAAVERIRLAENRFMTLDGIADVNSDGTDGYEAGPGLRFTLPIFNGNAGGIAIAKESAEMAKREFVAIRDQIDLEVRQAFTQMLQAEQQVKLANDEILPVLTEAQELSQRNYTDGGVPFFLVLQTTGQLIDAKLQRLQFIADRQSAVAVLERSIGRQFVSDEIETVGTKLDEVQEIDSPSEIDLPPTADEPIEPVGDKESISPKL